VINVAGLGLTGFDAAEWLEEHGAVVPELATLKVGWGCITNTFNAHAAAFAKCGVYGGHIVVVV
jgi:hypothetical protein